jgi:hypothetical protein
MKRAPLALVAVLALSGSFLAGTRIGAASHYLADTEYKASLTSGYLRLIEEGPVGVGTLKEIKEAELDTYLADHGRHMKSPFKWLWPGMIPEDDTGIRLAVAYRISHPVPTKDLTKPENWNPGVDMSSPFVRGVIEGQKENEQLRKKVISEYGAK